MVGPGAIVQSQRESLGLTRQDVADSLNLSARVVEALENENWAELPGPAFVRGYLRAYAKLLDLDGEAVAQAFESAGDGAAARIGSIGMPPVERRRGMTDLLQKHPGAVLSGAVGLVICAVAVVLLAVWPHAPQSTVANAAAMTSDVAEPRPMTAVATSPSSPAPVDAAESTAPRVVPAAVETDEHGARRITPTGNDRLTFSFSGDSWVDIKDAHGTALYSNAGKAGETLELVGHAPFHIVVGNAPSVVLQFNDERVTLTPHTRNNVGTLVLGQ